MNLKSATIAVIVKTDINTDGRVLNQLSILSSYFTDSQIYVILLPDRPVKIALWKNVNVINVECSTRNNRYLRFFTVLEWSLKTIKLLRKLKPDIIHAHDTGAVLPAVIYRLLNKYSFYMIYDDHEIPNENQKSSDRIMSSVENKLMKLSDLVITANNERKDYLQKTCKIFTRIVYFLNLPYYEPENNAVTVYRRIYNDQLRIIDKEISEGIKFIIHQGPLLAERGRKTIAEFSKSLPYNFKILLIGGSIEDFNKFISEYGLDEKKFLFIGKVDYFILNDFWDKSTASIVIYLPNLINNKLCAPNRLYLSFSKNIPIIVNQNNPVLSNFVKTHKFGYYIENFKSYVFKELNKTDVRQHNDEYNKLLLSERSKLIDLYSEALRTKKNIIE